MTTLIQKWVYKGEHVGETRYITPWGMKATFGHVLSTDSCRYIDAKDTKTEPDLWGGYSVQLHHPPTIDCTEAELTEELRKAWPVIDSLWMAENNLARTNNRKPEQIACWKKQQNEHFTELPNVVRLIQILVATPANTSPLERSYTKLQIVAAKRRNHFTSIS